MRPFLIVATLFVFFNCPAQSPTPFNCSDGKWGYTDEAGMKMIINCKYQSAYAFSIEGLAKVKLDNKYGYINKKGVEVIKIKYDEITESGRGTYLAKADGKAMFIDKTEKHLSADYDDADVFKDNMAPVKIGGKWGFVNRTYKLVVAPKYDLVWGYAGHRAAVKLNGKWGYVDQKGNEITPIIYEDVTYFFVGQAKVKLNGKDVVIDSTGKEVK